MPPRPLAHGSNVKSSTHLPAYYYLLLRLWVRLARLSVLLERITGILESDRDGGVQVTWAGNTALVVDSFTTSLLESIHFLLACREILFLRVCVVGADPAMSCTCEVAFTPVFSDTFARCRAERFVQVRVPRPHARCPHRWCIGSTLHHFSTAEFVELSSRFFCQAIIHRTHRLPP